MKIKYFLMMIGAGVLTAVAVNSCAKVSATNERRHDFADVFDIAYTPDTLHGHSGLFTDAGAWIGFTPPEKGNWVNGFCGPYSIDMSHSGIRPITAR